MTTRTKIICVILMIICIVFLSICLYYSANSSQITKSPCDFCNNPHPDRDTAERFMKSDTCDLVMRCLVYKDDPEKYPMEAHSIVLENTPYGNVSVDELLGCIGGKKITFTCYGWGTADITHDHIEIGCDSVGFDDDECIRYAWAFIQAMAKMNGFEEETIPIKFSHMDYCGHKKGWNTRALDIPLPIEMIQNNTFGDKYAYSNRSWLRDYTRKVFCNNESNSIMNLSAPQ